MKALGWAALLVATPALAQGDARLRTVPYVEDGITTVKVVPGYLATVVLGADERVESVAVGNSAAWEVTPNKNGDHLFIKPLMAGVSTNVEVVTDSRHYTLLLQTTFEGDPEAALQLRFDYGARAGGMPAATGGPNGGGPNGAGPNGGGPAAAGPATALREPGRYRVSGSRAARPLAISDDGSRTSMVFDDQATLPAIYAIDDQGHETLVTLRRADDAWTVDRVWRGYVFRLGKATARARRVDAR